MNVFNGRFPAGRLRPVDPPDLRRGLRRILEQASSLLLVVGLGVAAGCSKKPAAAPPPPPRVEVMAVVATNLPLTTEIIGQLDSPENVDVRARVEAFVEKVLFVEGSDVKEGDPLFKLDERPFQEALANARGQLAQARASLLKSERDVARLKPLAAKKAIPQQDLDNAEAAVEVSRAAVLSATAVEQSALLNLGYCDVRAPSSGRIGARQVSVGDLVGKGEPTLLATISRLNPIWFYCSVSEVAYLRTEAAVRRTGTQVESLPVTLLLADGSESAGGKGRFVFRDRAVDPKTGTLRLRAEFPNPDNLLRPGMFGRIRIDLGNRPDALVVPAKAVVELQGRNFVWVVGDDNKVQQRGIQVAESTGDGVVVQDGLQAGERIVVEGLQKVRQDAVVQPLTAAQMAEAAQAARDAAASHHSKD